MEVIKNIDSQNSLCLLTEKEVKLLALINSFGEEELEPPVKKIKKPGRPKQNKDGDGLREYIMVDGRAMTRSQVSKKFNIPYNTLWGRLVRGWTDEMITAKPRSRRSKRFEARM